MWEKTHIREKRRTKRKHFSVHTSPYAESVNVTYICGKRPICDPQHRFIWKETCKKKLLTLNGTSACAAPPLVYVKVTYTCEKGPIFVKRDLYMCQNPYLCEMKRIQETDWLGMTQIALNLEAGTHLDLPVEVCCSVLQCVAVCCSVLQSEHSDLPQTSRAPLSGGLFSVKEPYKRGNILQTRRII